MAKDKLIGIGEVARRLGVTPSTIRRWEKEGDGQLPYPARTRGGHRRWWLQDILRLQGFTKQDKG